MCDGRVVGGCWVGDVGNEVGVGEGGATSVPCGGSGSEWSGAVEGKGRAIVTSAAIAAAVIAPPIFEPASATPARMRCAARAPPALVR